MNIDFKTIPHKDQRYDTVGDYQEDEHGVHFTISEMDDGRHEMLIMVHELVEFFLVKLSGISLKSIDDFDIEFEKNRTDGNEGEPGDDQRAPYFMQHQLATVVERVVAVMLGVLWKDYERAINEL